MLQCIFIEVNALVFVIIDTCCQYRLGDYHEDHVDTI